MSGLGEVRKFIKIKYLLSKLLQKQIDGLLFIFFTQNKDNKQKYTFSAHFFIDLLDHRRVFKTFLTPEISLIMSGSPPLPPLDNHSATRP